MESSLALQFQTTSRAWSHWTAYPLPLNEEAQRAYTKTPVRFLAFGSFWLANAPVRDVVASAPPRTAWFVVRERLAFDTPSHMNLRERQNSRRPGRQPSRGDRSLRHRNRLRAIPSTPRPQGRQARERSRTAFHEPVIAYTTRFASAYYSPASAKSRFALEIPPWISMTVPVTNALAGDAR